MISTALVTASFLGLLVGSVVLWAVALRLGLRWAKVERASIARIALTVAVTGIVQYAILVLFAITAGKNPIVPFVLQLAGSVLVPCAVIALVFKTNFVRAIQAWLPTLLVSVAGTALIFLVFKPFLVEAFQSPSNGMAPTLLGQHARDVCPECGRPNYGSPSGPLVFAPPWRICDAFHVTESTVPARDTGSPDRFLVAKFLKPKRWDVVTFRYPAHPQMMYVKRLVGLPGEEVQIKDGAVWVDGKKLTPPKSLRGIEYRNELPDLPVSLWGSPASPAILRDDEYFVLGDFSVMSKDSRVWETGVPGHNPYAVPERYLEGVVTHIYWPPDRWRILR